LIFRNAAVGLNVAKTDYAINEGDNITDTHGGPETRADGDSPGYQWRDTKPATGVSFQPSQIRYEDLRDGASHIYPVGEKYVSTAG
jgi:hypothetical protein